MSDDKQSSLPGGKLPEGFPTPQGEVTVEEITVEKLKELQEEQRKRAAAGAAAAASAKATFSFPLHARYLHYSLSALPPPYVSLDTNRLTLAHFCVQSLSVLQDPRLFHPAKGKEVRGRMVKWILNLMVTKPSGDGKPTCVGFTGGTWQGLPYVDRLSCAAAAALSTTIQPTIHLAMTYCALLTLMTLGHPLTGIDCEAVMEGVKSLQNLDKEHPLYGSFKSHDHGSEADMRFVYCAVCIELVTWKILHPGVAYDGADSTYIDKEALKTYVKRCKCYDGGLSLLPGHESHGGSYFTGLAR